MKSPLIWACAVSFNIWAFVSFSEFWCLSKIFSSMCNTTSAQPAWSCSSISSHAWHAPLVEFPAACHVQVMSADIQVSARSGTQLPVVLLHITDLHSWPSSVTFSWCKQTAGTTFLHGRLWTAFLRFFWPDCLEWYAGSSAQPGLSDFRQLLKTALFQTVPV